MNVKMDDCFQFGLGAFETISVVDGRPIFLDRHLRRLEDAARFLDLGMPAERGIDRITVLEYLRKWMSEHDYRDRSGHMRRCSVLFLSSLSLLFLFDIIMISFCLYFVNSNSNILFFEY